MGEDWVNRSDAASARGVGTQDSGHKTGGRYAGVRPPALLHDYS